MNLRPHHLLCIQKFTGHGYNAGFTEHMKAIVSKLTDCPETPVMIVHGCDDLCEMCPNKRNGVCVSLEKVSLMDKMVLSTCGLSDGDLVSWTELSGNVRKQILTTDRFTKICACCQWFELCRNTEVSYEQQKRKDRFPND